MITIRKLAEFLVAQDSCDTPGSEVNLIAIDNKIKNLLDGAMAYICDRPGTNYTVMVEVDCRAEFPELQDLNKQYGEYA